MSSNIFRQDFNIDLYKRESLNKHKALVVWFIGLSGSGKSTLANLLEVELFNNNVRTFVLDGDNIRGGLNKDLGFTIADRKENLRRVAEVANLLKDAGLVVLASFITPFKEERDKIKNLLGEESFCSIYVKCPLEVCEARDTKALYKKARSGEIKDFTGITSPFEVPTDIDFVIQSDKETPQESINKLLPFILNKIQLK